MSAMGHKLAHQATDELRRLRQERAKLMARVSEISYQISEMESVLMALGEWERTEPDAPQLVAGDDNVLDLPGWKGARG